jgi:2-succinyl-5-enolpyruvyl-6-hydroxy-3-cyclohexene-1-carboxylate synthase
MVSSAKKNVQLLVQQLVELGLRHIVFSPGSRNASLVIACNQHPDIETLVVPDERSAAFIALGMAQQLQQPVGICCTSGSAALNYYPAIAEAYYQGIPMIVLTADRPQEWVNQGDGQTIVQENVFKNHIRYSVSLPEEESKQWFLTREICTAYRMATEHFPGPVHLNLPFEEPLYQQVEIDPSTLPTLKFQLTSVAGVLSAGEIHRLKNQWIDSKRKMIICGQLPKDELLESYLLDLAKDPSVCILVENTSNLTNKAFIHCIDRTLNSILEEEKEHFKPDILVTIGGAVVSKRIKSFLRTHKPKEHWKVGFDFPFMDTYQALTESIQVPLQSFFKEVKSWPIQVDGTFGLVWKQLDFQIQELTQQFFTKNTNYGDLSVFQTVLDYVPERSHLHMSNSSVVRYCQLFDSIRSVQYWCNRGTSGIDGSSSTAVGAAFIQKDTWNILLTGDISFFYDSNAFWNHIPVPNLRIFLINNGGGGIFKIIPGPDTTKELNDFFVFNNQADASGICKAYDLAYFSASSLVEIEQQMEVFYSFEENGRPKLMEIHTQDIENEKLLARFFTEVALKKKRVD